MSDIIKRIEVDTSAFGVVSTCVDPKGESIKREPYKPPPSVKGLGGYSEEELIREIESRRKYPVYIE